MLRIEHLGCLAGGKPVLQDITTAFEPGAVHVILGPNGSGKSTFLKAFSGEWPVARKGRYGMTGTRCDS